MNETLPATMIQRSGDMLSAYMEDILLILSVEQGQYFSLSKVATRVWDLLEKPTTQALIVAQLLDEYEVTAEICARDLEVFLGALRQRHLLADVPPPCA
jgi:hypothetical protein